MARVSPHRCRVLVAGVGGQGVLVAARAIGDAALAAGCEVAVGQLHGMSQRGGSVEATVVMGSSREAFVGAGGADVIVGLDAVETLRALPRMSRRTTVVATCAIVPVFALALEGKSDPDSDAIFARVRAAAGAVVVVDSASLLRDAGAEPCLNALLLGALAEMRLLPFDGALLLHAIDRSRASARLRDANHRAFALGRAAVERSSTRSRVERGVECP